MNCYIKIYPVLFLVLSFQISAQDIYDEIKASLLNINHEAKLLPSPEGNGGNGIKLGYSVSIDGDKALVGSPDMNDGGFVYVFEFNGSSWVLTSTLELPAENKQYKFGYSVSLSGNRALIGAYGDDNNFGSAYVFDFDGSVWVNSQKLVASDRAKDDLFGRVVNLSGNRAVIGAPWDDDVEYSSGSAYVFDYDGENWKQSQKLVADIAGQSDYFGSEVSVFGDRIAVGANNFDGSGTNESAIGAVYIYENDGTSWIYKQQLVSSDPSFQQRFGTSISLSNDRILIGSQSDANFIYDFDGNNWIEKLSLPHNNITYVGSNNSDSVSLDGDNALIGNFYNNTVKLYKFDGSTWSLDQIFEPNNLGDNPEFGWAVGLSEGNIVVGAISANDTFKNSSGSVLFYSQDIDSVWNENYSFSLDENGSGGAYFGNSVSINGTRALVGAYHDDGDGKYTGAAYIYDFDGLNWILSKKLTATDAIDYDYFGSSVSLQGDRAVIGAYGVVTGDNSGSAYVFDFDGKNWNQTQKLTPIVDFNYNSFGVSVSLYGDNIVVGADRAEHFGDGAAYVFSFDGNNWIQTQKLFALDGTGGERFGSSVDIYQNRILIGDPFDDDLGHNSGSTYIFDYNGEYWQQTQKLTASDGTQFDRFGTSVSLENNRLVIGASYKDQLDFRLVGSAYVFENDNNSWQEKSILIAEDSNVNDRFGTSVQISNNNILIGSQRNNENSGSGYLFNLVNNQWKLSKKILAVDAGEYDFFGSSVSIYGTKAIIGASRNNDHGSDSGSAYIYDLDSIFHNGFE